MRIKLWHKFALLLVSTSSLILLASFYFSQQSFTRGFLEYLNAQEGERTDYLVGHLVEDYARYANWSFVSENPQAWHQYLAEIFRQAGQEGLFPELRPENPAQVGRGNAPLNQSGSGQTQFQPPPREEYGQFQQRRPSSTPYGPEAQGGSRENFRPPPPRGEGRFQPWGPPNKANRPMPQTGPGRNQFRPPPLPGNDGPRPLLQVALENPHGQIIAGAMGQNSAFSRIPLHLESRLIGQLLVKRVDQFSSKAEKEFVNQQNRIFSQIAGLAIILISLLAWWLGRLFNRRINPLSEMAHQLAAGNYQNQLETNRHDELGQLSQDLNQLASKLEQNRGARQRWIADISHELRTPIAVLQGELEALLDGIRPLKMEAIASLKSEVSRLTQLVEDLYQLSLSDVGALSYQFEQVDLLEILKQSLSGSTAQLESHSISTRIKLQPNQDFTISGDRLRLEQLFKNLIQNTLRYTDSPGKLQIKIFKVKHGTGHSILLHWSDSAPGAPQALYAKLFDRMVRAEGSRSRQTGGAGLGLAIVKQIVVAHKGQIRAEASPFGGLTIKMHFPFYVG